MYPKLNLIFATDNSGLFGQSNKLPWRIKEDLVHFSKITTDVFVSNVVVMGKNTWLSLEKKLPNRTNVVISKTLEDGGYDEKYDTLDDFIKASIKYSVQKIFIIGGIGLINECFTKYKYLIDEVYYTHVHKEFPQDSESIVFDTSYIMRLNQYIISERTIETEEGRITFKKYKLPEHEELQYLKLLDKCLTKGDKRFTRNGITYSLFSDSLKFDLKKGFPLLTTKKVFMRGIFEELMFFLRGQTDSKILEEKGVKIWHDNTTKEFIEKCGLPYEEGDMGCMYGWQWRHFGAEYIDSKTDYTGKGFDQLEYVMGLLIKDPHSRRILMTDYNPSQATKGVLYPCHSLVLQFYVRQNEKEGKYYVSVVMYQRSVDMACGIPFNIASTALLLTLLCKTLNSRIGDNMYIPDIMTLDLGDIHVYDEHYENIKEQIQRIPYAFPTINIKNEYNSMEEYKWEDIEIFNYASHPAIKYKMIA